MPISSGYRELQMNVKCLEQCLAYGKCLFFLSLLLFSVVL